MARKSKFSEARQKAAVAEHMGGKSIDALAKELGITKTTFYSWKKKFGGGKKPKKTTAKKAAAKPAAAKPAARRGRPKGTAKKKAGRPKRAAAKTTVAKPAARRGRPKGTASRKRRTARPRTAPTTVGVDVAALKAENSKLKKMLFDIWLKQNM